jgi:hypothetical protein
MTAEINFLEILYSSILTSGMLTIFLVAFFKYYFDKRLEELRFSHQRELSSFTIDKEKKTESFQKLITSIEKTRLICKEVIRSQKDYEKLMTTFEEDINSLISSFSEAFMYLDSEGLVEEMYDYYHLIRDFKSELKDNFDFSKIRENSKLKDLVDIINETGKKCEKSLSARK